MLAFSAVPCSRYRSLNVVIAQYCLEKLDHALTRLSDSKWNKYAREQDFPVSETKAKLNAES